jgi:hypothetical protein
MMKKYVKCKGMLKLSEKEQKSFSRLINEEEERHFKNVKKICQLYGTISIKIMYELSKTRMEAIEEAVKKAGMEYILED